MERIEFIIRIVLYGILMWLNGFLVRWFIEIIRNKKK